MRNELETLHAGGGGMQEEGGRGENQLSLSLKVKL